MKNDLLLGFNDSIHPFLWIKTLRKRINFLRCEFVFASFHFRTCCTVTELLPILLLTCILFLVLSVRGLKLETDDVGCATQHSSRKQQSDFLYSYNSTDSQKNNIDPMKCSALLMHLNLSISIGFQYTHGVPNLNILKFREQNLIVFDRTTAGTHTYYTYKVN